MKKKLVLNNFHFFLKGKKITCTGVSVIDVKSQGPDQRRLETDIDWDWSLAIDGQLYSKYSTLSSEMFKFFLRASVQIVLFVIAVNYFGLPSVRRYADKKVVVLTSQAEGRKDVFFRIIFFYFFILGSKIWQAITLLCLVDLLYVN